MLMIPKLPLLLSVDTNEKGHWQTLLRQFKQRTQPPVTCHSGSRDYWCHWLQLVPDNAGVLVKRVISHDSGNERLRDCVDRFNQHFSGRGYKLSESTGLLNLKAEKPLPKTLMPIEHLVGQNFYHVIQQQQGSVEWMSILNEAQMLLSQGDNSYSGLRLAEGNQSTERSALSFVQGIWISPVPAWLKSVKNSEVLEGFHAWLSGDVEQLNHFLTQQRQLIESHVARNPDFQFSDGENCYQPTKRFKYTSIIRKSLHHVFKNN